MKFKAFLFLAGLGIISAYAFAEIRITGGGTGGSGSSTWPPSGTPSDLVQYGTTGTFSSSQGFTQNTTFYYPVQISSSVKMYTLAPDDMWILESSDITYPGNMRLGSNAGVQGGYFHFSTSLGSDRAKFGYNDTVPGIGFTVLAGSNKFFITSAGNIGINTSAPSALVQISSPAGTGGPLLRVTTGTTNLFEVTGTSINMTAVPVNVGSMTVSGGVSSVGTGPMKFTGAGEIQFDGDGDGVPEVSIGNGSTTIFGLVINDWDRFITPTFASGTFITYIASATMGISSSTLGQYQFNNAISSQANFCVYPWLVPADIDLRSPIILSSFSVTLGGADTNGQVYVVSLATNQASGNMTETKFSGSGAWIASNTVVIAGDANGASGDMEVSTGAIVLGLWSVNVIPGTLNYIIVSRDGDHGSDASTVNSYSAFFALKFKRKFSND